MLRTATWLATFVCATATAFAQVTVTVGPNPAPVGCNVWITVANDGPVNFVYGDGCPYVVRDAAGNAVRTLSCPLFAPVIVAPGTTSELIPWDQTDDFGNPVPPGAYTVEVNVTGTPSTHPLTIGGTGVGVSLLGTVRIGTLRHVGICAPAAGNGSYFLGVSQSSVVGIPACDETFPLDVDALFLFAIGTNGVFFAMEGPLDANGVTKAPAILTPNDPQLIGLTVELAAVAFDFGLPCPVAGVSEAVAVTVQ